MRRLFISLLLTTLLLTGCKSPKEEQPLPPTRTQSTEIFPEWEDRDIFTSGLLLSQQNYLKELADAPTYHIDFEIDSDLVHLRGYEEIRYTNQENIALDKIALHLFPNILGGEMSITETSINGESAPFAYAVEKSILELPLTAPLQPNESIVIAIDFTVTVPTELESNYGVFASTEGVLALAHAYPMLSVYDDEGWNTALPSEQGDVTYGDASFYIVRVNAPKELVLVGSGNEVEHQVEGDRQIVSFAIGPARDFYLAASEDYVRISEDFDTYTINSYAPAEWQEGAQMALDSAAAALAIYAEAYAPYPYTEFDIVSTPTDALGIEYPGMTAINVDLYNLSATFNGTPTSVYLESTIAHEVAHQWFYNLVGNDQVDEPWLDESLVQYITWQYYATRYGTSGEEGFGSALDERWQRVEHEKIPIGLPVTAYSGGEYGAIVYGRGAFFFEALAEEMGMDAFDDFLIEYTQSQQWEIASAESLRALAEKHCNCDLENLFNEWVY